MYLYLLFITDSIKYDNIFGTPCRICMGRETYLFLLQKFILIIRFRSRKARELTISLPSAVHTTKCPLSQEFLSYCTVEAEQSEMLGQMTDSHSTLATVVSVINLIVA